LNERTDVETLLDGDVFACLGDQTFESLTACYRGGTWPASQDAGGTFLDRPAAWRIAAFGTAARRRIHLVELRDALMAEQTITPDDLPTPQLRTEYVWFLFSQRAWAPIVSFMESMDDQARGELQPHVADIYFLSFYRLQIDRIMTGEDRDGFFAEARHVLALLESSWSKASEHLAAYQAMVDHISGDFDGARARFTGIGAGDFVSPLSALRTVLRDPSTYSRDAFNLVIRPAKQRRTTLISLDRIYFDRFARAFAERYSQNNRDSGLHFHCVGFDPGDEMQAWDLPVAIGVSVDTFDVSRLEPLDRAGYYAAARYIHLPEYLRLYEAIYIADADGLVLRDIATIESDLGAADVAFATRVLEKQRRLFRLPWESISAGSLFIRSTTGGRRFSEALAGYLQESVAGTFADGTPLWFADQNAIFYTWCDLRQEARFERFHRAAFAQELTWTLFESLDAKAEFIRRAPLPSQ